MYSGEKMKILLFAGNRKDSSLQLNKFLQKNDFPQNRFGEIVKYVEKTAVELSPSFNSFDNLYQILSGSPEKVVHIKDNIYACLDSDYKNANMITFVFIYDVDTSRPWTLQNNDGIEHIQYLDYKVLNEDLNYCDFIKKQDENAI